MVGSYESLKETSSGTNVENTKSEPALIVLTVVGKKETETSSKVEVEGVVVGETLGGNPAGVTGSADTSKETITFVVGSGKRWKVTSNAEKLLYSSVTF